MTTDEFKNKLGKFTKEDIIFAITKKLTGMERDRFVEALESHNALKVYDKAVQAEDREMELYEEYTALHKTYEDYKWEIAEKYGIVEFQEDGRKFFNYGRWLDSATKDEFNQALQFEREAKAKWQEWQEALRIAEKLRERIVRK